MNSGHPPFSRRDFVRLCSASSLLAAAAPGHSALEPAAANSIAKSGAAFPKNFVWGTATSAYQIEGAAREDGRGASVWDDFSHQGGMTWDGDTGDGACDHYHRYHEDIELMHELGVQAYRFSISWTRVLPGGTGPVNERGLDFYERLVDALLAKNVQPWTTLFHWDYPAALAARGGWLQADSPKWFADYVAIVADRLSDRIANWMTINEPQCFIGISPLAKNPAPALPVNLEQGLLAAHHVLLGHGLAVQTLRAHARTRPNIGWAAVGVVSYPASESAADIEAARVAIFDVPSANLWNNVWWADPALLGHYPEAGLQRYGAAVPKFTDAEMQTIHQPLDFYGMNIYQGECIRAGAAGQPEKVSPLAGAPRTLNGWVITPEALRWGPRYIFERYGVPVVVTENGISNPDWVMEDGAVRDPQRIDFLRRYLQAYRQAIADGVDARGYFVWSLLDNFEWADGYKQRFGLVHIDYQTQQRTLKESARWYAEIIRSRGQSLG